MGERKGQLKYYPPDFDYKTHKSLSGYHGEHSLRDRAKRIDEGILIIRFEMPFNMWCGGCRNHIGMGVRYNAEKSKVGKYYTTPIFKFRMRCHLCPNHIEIQTDPQHAAYVVVGGGERREQRWDAAENGQIAPERWENKKKLALDSMYKLEHTSNDETKGKTFQSNLSMLVNQDSDWKNEHLVSRVFSKHFKEEKKKRKQNEEFKKKYALDIDLLSDEESENEEIKKVKTTQESLSNASSISPLSSKSKINLKGSSKEMSGFLEKLSKKKVDMGGIMGIIGRGGRNKISFGKDLSVFNNSSLILKKIIPTNKKISNIIPTHTTTKNTETINTNIYSKETVKNIETTNEMIKTEASCNGIHSEIDSAIQSASSPLQIKKLECLPTDNKDNDNDDNDDDDNDDDKIHLNISNTTALSNLMNSYGSDDDVDGE